ncbi:hypothetical protein NL108_010960, partial [Boleophthalmus pectinirostris]
EEHLWELLANILEKTDPVSLAVSQRHPKTGQKISLQHLVAAGLWQTGYYADWMYREPRGGEGCVGAFSSRDLLLALGWIIAKGALEKLLSQRVEDLDTTLLTSTPESPKISSELQLDSNSLRRLQWSLGSLRHQGRILLSMQEERASLLHKVRKTLLLVCAVVSLGKTLHLPNLCEITDCACLQELCDLMEAYLKWKQVESVFWTWM